VVESVREAVPARTGTLVTIGFEGVTNEADYPLDVCAIDRGGQPFMGFVWLVVDGGIAGVSPVTALVRRIVKAPLDRRQRAAVRGGNAVGLLAQVDPIAASSRSAPASPTSPHASRIEPRGTCVVTTPAFRIEDLARRSGYAKAGASRSVTRPNSLTNRSRSSRRQQAGDRRVGGRTRGRRRACPALVAEPDGVLIFRLQGGVTDVVTLDFVDGGDDRRAALLAAIGCLAEQEGWTRLRH
jgi:hypothetical protein